MTQGLKPPSGMSAENSDLRPFTSLTLRKPKKVPLPSLSLCGNRDVTRGVVSDDGKAILVCCVVHADDVIKRLDIDNSSVGMATIVIDDCFVVVLYHSMLGRRALLAFVPFRNSIALSLNENTWETITTVTWALAVATMRWMLMMPRLMETPPMLLRHFSKSTLFSGFLG